jgi:hypothetical protein
LAADESAEFSDASQGKGQGDFGAGAIIGEDGLGFSFRAQGQESLSTDLLERDSSLRSG